MDLSIVLKRWNKLEILEKHNQQIKNYQKLTENSKKTQISKKRKFESVDNDTQHSIKCRKLNCNKKPSTSTNTDGFTLLCKEYQKCIKYRNINENEMALLCFVYNENNDSIHKCLQEMKMYHQQQIMSNM